RMPAAVRRRHRALRPQARALRLAARRPVRDQRGNGVLSAPPRQNASLLQPDRDHRPPCRRLAEVPVPRAGEDHPVLDADTRLREIHGSDRGGGDLAAMRTLAVIDGEHYPSTVRDALVELPHEFVGAFMAGGTEKLRGRPTTASPSTTTWRRRSASWSPSACSTCRTNPSWGPPRGSGSPAACSRWGSRTRGLTFGSSHRRSPSPSRCLRSPSLRPASASA